MVDLVCPICGMTFSASPSRIKKTRNGNVFCSINCQIEWQRRNRVNTKCNGCGKDIMITEKQVEQNKTHFCSDKCYKKYAVGDKHPNWKSGDYMESEFICIYCGKKFLGLNARDRKYCSPECGHKDRIGKSGPKRGARIKLTCEWCGDEFERLKCNVRSDYKHNFCSNNCQYAWMSENTRGENNWRWISDRTKVKNGRLDILRTSTDMKDWKLGVYKRDEFACQLCNSTKSGIFNCHHIKKLSKYPELAYDISNGITLCKSCHKVVTWNEEEYENLFDSIVNGFEC